jgi:hypothetical protein
VSTTGLKCSGGVRSATATELPLLFSGWSDRSWQSELAGRTVSGNLFAWVPSTGVQKVNFRLDAKAVRTDATSPFDLVEGNQWWAEPLLTSALTKGEHRIQIAAEKSGRCLTRTVSFTVA